MLHTRGDEANQTFHPKVRYLWVARREVNSHPVLQERATSQKAAENLHHPLLTAVAMSSTKTNDGFIFYEYPENHFFGGVSLKRSMKHATHWKGNAD